MKRVFKDLLSRVGGRGPRPNRVVVLCYHSVHPAKSFASVSPKEFEDHLSYLRESCDVIPFGQVLEAAKNQYRERPAVAITFDDGYADNYEYVLPILRRLAIVATFFITTGLVEEDPDVIQRIRRLRSAPYSEIRPLTWPQIREMHAAGMEVGSHSWGHRNLARLHPDEVEQELRRSKEVLEERLGRPIRLLAYPFGKPRRHFTEETMNLAAQVGFQQAAAVISRGVQPGDHPMSVPRFIVTRDTREVLAAKIRGSWDIVGWWQERAPMPLARLASPEDFRV